MQSIRSLVLLIIAFEAIREEFKAQFSEEELSGSTPGNEK